MHETVPRDAFHQWTFSAIVLALLASPLSAADWPQWRGPQRNGVSSESGLLKQWPEAGPKLLWRTSEVGSGYSTAVLSKMVREIVTTEFYEELALQAKERVIGMGSRNVKFFAGDGTDSDYIDPEWQFDGLIVFAACIKTPYSIVNLLKPGGVAVFPMGPAHQQQITRFTNNFEVKSMHDNYQFHDFCVFESIRGQYGWVDQDDSFIVEEADIEATDVEETDVEEADV